MIQTIMATLFQVIVPLSIPVIAFSLLNLVLLWLPANGIGKLFKFPANEFPV
ncbi:hypothetical protein [Bacillus sp. AFS073361]|uniref:hypothetical protein n=1 Tax=Bacillus sp. AFS073361 TaxID=2033511 RepID=UPI0015D4B48F|nr:hypothetical protein [Bacillus sp. AFS073361]